MARKQAPTSKDGIVGEVSPPGVPPADCHSLVVLYKLRDISAAVKQTE